MAEEQKQEQQQALDTAKQQPSDQKPVESSTEKKVEDQKATDQNVEPSAEEKKPEGEKQPEKKPEEKKPENLEDNSVIRQMRRALKNAQRELSELKRAQVQQQVAAQPAPERTQFQTEGAYLQAAIEHHNRQQQALQQAPAVDILEQTRRDARAAHPDFDQALRSIEHIRFKQESLNALAESLETLEFGPELYYHLAKNPEVTEDLAILSPAAFAARIGELHADIRRNKQQPPAKPVSKAPAPITPVTNGTPPSKGYDQMTPEEFHQVRMKERKAARMRILAPTT